jgi:threonine dehydrogenase-like Zn-dependent dehydrogenase
MTEKTVLLIGAGTVGRSVANFLALSPSVEKLIVADKDKLKAHLAAINAEVSAIYFGLGPKVEHVALDLNDEENAADLIGQIDPNVIIHCTTMLPCWFYIPLIKRRIKEIGLDGYYPAHTVAKDLVLVYKLMKAVKRSGTKARTVNITFPDNVHPALYKQGLSPTIGAGNVDITALGVRKIVANRLNLPVRSISVTIIGHHALNWAPPEKLPYYIKIRMGEKDITKKFNTHELITAANDFLVRDYDEQMAASSAVKQALSILEDRGEIVLGSGVSGITGCLPVRLGAKDLEIVMPDDLSLDEAIKMNEMGLKMDGIEGYEPDGTIIFTEKTARLLEEGLGIKRRRLRLDEAEEMAKELISAYNSLDKKYKGNQNQ